MRYVESLEPDVNADAPSILGGIVEDVPTVDTPISGASIAVKIILSMDIKLCSGCQKEFLKVCELVAAIINNCAASDLEVEEKNESF